MEPDHGQRASCIAILRPVVQDFAGGDAIAACFARVRHLEHALHEIRYALRLPSQQRIQSTAPRRRLLPPRQSGAVSQICLRGIRRWAGERVSARCADSTRSVDRLFIMVVTMGGRHQSRPADSHDQIRTPQCCPTPVTRKWSLRCPSWMTPRNEDAVLGGLLRHVRSSSDSSIHRV